MNRRKFFKNIGAVGAISVVAPTMLIDIINSGDNEELYGVVEATIKNGVFKCKTAHKLKLNDVIIVTDRIKEEQFIVTRIKNRRIFNAVNTRKETNMSEHVHLMVISRDFKLGEQRFKTI